MSGAAGLSAARRRRAGGSSIPQSAGVATPPPAPQKTRSSTPHPMQILQDHEMRLRKIEPLMESLRTSSESQTPSVDLTGVMARIVALETQTQKAQSETSSESLSEMFMKLQTFAMETNTLVLKMQTRIDELETQLAEKEEEDETSMVALSDVGQELQVVEEEEEEEDDGHDEGETVTEN